MKPVTRISTTPAPASTRRRRFGEHAELLASSLLGNPHSASPASSDATRLVERSRRAVLDWFNARRDDYTAIFTLNATGALKHVGESYPFAAGGRLLLTVDNHNSVNGIREFARARGAAVDVRAADPARAAHRSIELDALARRRRRAGAELCSPFPRSPTSRA